MSARAHDDPQTTRRRRWRRRRWFAYVVTFLLLGAFGGFIYLTHPYRVSAVAQDIIQKQTGATVTIDGARFELDGTIRLFGVEMRIPDVPGNPEGGNRLFQADEILIEHQVWALLGGSIDMERVFFKRPVFYPTEDVDHGKFTFQYLKPQLKPQPKKKKGREPMVLPNINLASARIVFGEIKDGEYTVMETVQLDGKQVRDPDDPGTYHFALRQNQGRTFALSGSFNLWRNELTAQLQVDRLTKNDRRIRLLPHKLRALITEWEPVGAFSRIRFGHNEEQKFHADLEIREAGLSIPWGQTRLRVEDTSGTIHLSKTDQIDAKLKGRAEGSNYWADYEMEATVQGLGLSPKLEASVHVNGEIPGRPEDFELLPGWARYVVGEFSPRGRFTADLNAMTDQLGDSLVMDGRLQFFEGEIKYRHFPYPLTQVYADIRFDMDHVTIEKVSGFGKPDAFGRRAEVNIRGHVVAPGRGSGMELIIDADNLPLDDTLLAAMTDEQREPLEMFLHRPSYERLTADEGGILQSTAQQQQRTQDLEHKRDELAMLRDAVFVDSRRIEEIETQIARTEAQLTRPIFDLGGAVDVKVVIAREPGDGWPQPRITARPDDGLNVLYRDWPYPLTVRSGEVTIALPHDVTVEGLKLDSTGGAQVSIEGALSEPKQKGKPLAPKLKLAATGIPIDDTLVASIPPEQSKWITDLALAGSFDAEGTVFTDQAGDPDFRISVTGENASAKPFGGGYELTDVSAKLTLGRGFFRLHHLRGSHGESAIEVTGAPHAGDPADFQLSLTGTKMRFDDPILDLLPPNHNALEQLRLVNETYKPKGTFDFELRPRDADAEQYELLLTPHDLKFTLRGTEIALRRKAGRVRIDDQQIRFEQCEGAFRAGTFALSGSYSRAPNGPIDLTFSVNANQFDDVAAALVPEEVVTTLRALEVNGKYRMKDARLTYTPTPTSKPTESNDETAPERTGVYAFDATVEMDKLNASIGVPITELIGVLDVKVRAEARAEDRDTPALMDLRLRATRLRAADRLVQPVTVRVTNEDDRRVIAIKDLKGHVYKGSLTGSGKVWFEGEKTKYQMDVAIQEANLDPFLEPLKVKPSGDDASPRPAANVQLIGDHNSPNGAADADDTPNADNAQANKPATIERKRIAVLSASLSVEGEPDNPGSRRGRGELRIRDAQLYETPVGFAVLQLMNLALPNSKAFNKVEASYVLDGDLVHLSRLVFASPSISIIGSGTMRYSTLALNIDLASANPKGLDLGPLTDVIKLLKDELISVKVTGTLEEPKAKLQSLSGVSDSVNKVLGQPKTTPEEEKKP